LQQAIIGRVAVRVLQFEDAAQNVRNVADNAKGYGSGDASVRQWKSTGTIPPGLSPGVGAVWKKLVYPCIFGTVREIKTKFIPIVINPRPDSIGD
jgi:hypothetical protein